ncbi:Fe(3+) ABC transporter substrate-binding protein [Metabacillus idriensis]|uniref:Fe(3+) ABC transporter substrate-binding protein n=1 Tax=Metabacillus idriensis TaxID=324768 RepID=UPI0008A9359A|nr:Fe(3+) ABC transporter substrate-binding protein [Metabacillus idriensis]MCM3597277.1 Fe(3+) ABC transporter substrate-binding protein [Metabacillus idriensis]OHR73187.1 Fe(3+) ABC transporter substrate-binding protein [Bacillus sp. HMSC76G11]
MVKKFSLMISFMLVLLLALTGCVSSTDKNNESKESAGKEKTEDPGAVNVYTSRHYEADQELYKKFEEETGIKVNVVEGEGDELMERLSMEGEATEADVYITADAGNLYQAKDRELLQAVESDVLAENIPEKLRDVDNQWFGLTKRARVIVYAKDRVKPEELSTYEALTEPEWKDRVVVRSSENMYNMSLLASFIDVIGADKAKEWAAGIKGNMARDPEGGDRDQAKAVVAGEADVAIMNTYYLGVMANGEDEEERKVAENVGVFFPNQETTGTHINVSGAGVTKNAKNKENAVKFIEFLSGKEAQGQFAEANYEYPVNKNVEPSEFLKAWGDFKEQDVNLSVLGENQQEAIRIFNEVGWK